MFRHRDQTTILVHWWPLRLWHLNFLSASSLPPHMQPRVNPPVEMMVGLPSSSPLNQSVGTDCPELDQPQWPLLLLSFQRSACTVSEAAARSLKWKLISPSPLPVSLFVFISLWLGVLTRAWSFTAQTWVTRVLSFDSKHCLSFVN